MYEDRSNRRKKSVIIEPNDSKNERISLISKCKKRKNEVDSDAKVVDLLSSLTRKGKEIIRK
jgi:hypothetical protein